MNPYGQEYIACKLTELKYKSQGYEIITNHSNYVGSQISFISKQPVDLVLFMHKKMDKKVTMCIVQYHSFCK